MLKSMFIHFLVLYFFSMGIIGDVETNSDRENKRRMYYILAMKSCILPSVIGAPIGNILGYLMINLGYMYYGVIYIPLMAFISSCSYCIYDHFYPKDNKNTTYK